jgi:2-dehydro-3-deoxyphosphooctonate aldolase (KDO 8-P synthase)
MSTSNLNPHASANPLADGKGKKAPDKLKFFIGPCVLESRELVMLIAETLHRELSPFFSDIELTFKGSFDKANRSSITSFRGPGLKQGLEWLSEVRDRFHLPVVTDYHTPDQAMAVAEVVDVLQLPAFLCRQTDMVIEGARACAKYGRTFKMKKAQFMAPEDMKNVVDKAHQFLPLSQILLTERGTTFGYQNLIVDMSSFQTMGRSGVKTIYDATHSVQRPGGLGTSTGGKRENAFVLAKAAIAAGAQGVFIETHPTPDKALSDPTTCLDLTEIKTWVQKLTALYRFVQGECP